MEVLPVSVAGPRSLPLVPPTMYLTTKGSRLLVPLFPVSLPEHETSRTPRGVPTCTRSHSSALNVVHVYFTSLVSLSVAKFSSSWGHRTGNFCLLPPETKRNEDHTDTNARARAQNLYSSGHLTTGRHTLEPHTPSFPRPGKYYKKNLRVGTLNKHSMYCYLNT